MTNRLRKMTTVQGCFDEVNNSFSSKSWRVAAGAILKMSRCMQCQCFLNSIHVDVFENQFRQSQNFGRE
jgi:hypothetical protein